MKVSHFISRLRTFRALFVLNMVVSWPPFRTRLINKQTIFTIAAVGATNRTLGVTKSTQLFNATLDLGPNVHNLTVNHG